MAIIFAVIVIIIFDDISNPKRLVHSNSDLSAFPFDRSSAGSFIQTSRIWSDRSDFGKANL